MAKTPQSWLTLLFLGSIPSFPAPFEIPFHPKGLSGLVSSLESIGDTLIAAGRFDGADGVQANNIALWDGSRWNALGKGVHAPGLFFKTVTHGKEIFATGPIDSVNGAPCRFVVRWDGAQWHCLDMDRGYWVVTIELWHDTLLAATDSGAFQWTGSKWQPFGRPFKNLERTSNLKVMNGELWLYGGFEVIGDTSFRNLARWNGGDWRKPMAIHPGPIVDAAWHQGSLFWIEGYPPPDGNLEIRKWDGVASSVVPVDFTSPSLDRLFSDGQGLSVIGGERIWDNPGYDLLSVQRRRSGLVVGTYDGQRFKSAYRYAFDGWIAAATPVPGGFAIGGRFAAVDGGRADNVALIKAGVSYAVSVTAKPGPSQAAGVMLGDGATLYAGGVNFAYAGDTFVGGVAAWDGSTWRGFGGGLRSRVSQETPDYFPVARIAALAKSGSDLYVGGAFDTAGSIPARSIARWDGGTWRGLGDGFNGKVTAILPAGDAVYVAGRSTIDDTLNGKAALGQLYISKWEANGWTIMDTYPSGNIQKLVMHRGALCAIGALSGSDRERQWLYSKSPSGWWFPNGQTKMDAKDALVLGSDLYAVGKDVVRVDSTGKHTTLLTDAWGAALATDGKRIFMLCNGDRDIPGLGRTSLAMWDGAVWRVLATGLLHWEAEPFGVPVSMAVAGGFLYVSGWFKPMEGGNSWFYARLDLATGTWSRPPAARKGVSPQAWIGFATGSTGIKSFRADGRFQKSNGHGMRINRPE